MDKPSSAPLATGRFRFRIRSLLVVTACCAAAIAFVSAVIRHRNERRELLAPIQSIGGEIGTSSQGQYLTLRRHISDAQLERLCKHLQQFPRLYHIYIYGKVSDQGIAHLQELPQLRELVLSNNLISDAGVEHISALQHLQELHLVNTNVSDRGAAMLGQLSNLRLLYLDGTAISDEGVDHLLGLRDLEFLSLTDTNVSPNAVARLRQQLPDTYINSSSPRNR